MDSCWPAGSPRTNTDSSAGPLATGAITSPTGRTANNNSKVVRFTVVPPLNRWSQRSYARGMKVQGIYYRDATRLLRRARNRCAPRRGVEAAARSRVRGVGGTWGRVGGADRRPALQGGFGVRRGCREGEVSARRRAVGREPAQEPQDVGPRQGARLGRGGEYHARDRAHPPQPVPPQVERQLGGPRHGGERRGPAVEGHRQEAHGELLGQVRGPRRRGGAVQVDFKR